MSAKTLARRERPWRGADDPGEGCLPPLVEEGGKVTEEKIYITWILPISNFYNLKFRIFFDLKTFLYNKTVEEKEKLIN